MTETSVSHKLFTVTTSPDNRWLYVAEAASIGGNIPEYLRVFSPSTSQIYGPAYAVTIAGQPVAYRFPQADNQSEVMVIL